MSMTPAKKGQPGPPSVTGAIDADGHVLEPPDTWRKHIDPKYRDRAIGLAKNSDGLEVFLIDGKPSRLLPPGFPGVLGGLGGKDIEAGAGRSHGEGAPL